MSWQGWCVFLAARARCILSVFSGRTGTLMLSCSSLSFFGHAGFVLWIHQITLNQKSHFSLFITSVLIRQINLVICQFFATRPNLLIRASHTSSVFSSLVTLSCYNFISANGVFKGNICKWTHRMQVVDFPPPSVRLRARICPSRPTTGK